MIVRCTIPVNEHGTHQTGVFSLKMMGSEVLEMVAGDMLRSFFFLGGGWGYIDVFFSPKPCYWRVVDEN